MPELPEVEVTRRGIEPHLRDRRIHAVVVRESRLRWPVDAQLARLLTGLTIVEVSRRGKYLLCLCADAASVRGWLIVHLGMTGTLRILNAHLSAGSHDHIDLFLSDSAGREAGVLRFRDPRRFGAVLWHPIEAGPVDAHPLLAGLGVEPFGPDFAADAGGRLLFARSRGRSLAVKSFLLAGHAVVGVGNIYASEALFHAGIRPTTAAGRIGLTRYQRLAQSIRDTLAEAIRRGGSTLRDFVGSHGEQGYFQLDAMVYDRAGLPCRACAMPIRHLVQGQRSTYYCPRCQH